MSLKADYADQCYFSIPEELILEIFFHLNLVQLKLSPSKNLNFTVFRTISCVSKEWQRIVTQFINKEIGVMKETVYQNIAFGSEKWAQYFGKGVADGDSIKEELLSLPDNMMGILKSSCQLFRGKRIMDSHMLVRIPQMINGKPFNLNTLGELAKNYFPQNLTGYLYIDDSVVHELGNKLVDKSYWVLMIKEMLLDSRTQSISKHKALAMDFAKKTFVPYEIPTTLEAVACIFAQYISTKERLFDWQFFTHCSDTVNEGNPVMVGGFVEEGLRIQEDWSGNGIIGLAPLWRL